MLWYSLETPRRGTSNEHNIICFRGEIRKNIRTFLLAKVKYLELCISAVLGCHYRHLLRACAVLSSTVILLWAAKEILYSTGHAMLNNGGKNNEEMQEVHNHRSSSTSANRKEVKCERIEISKKQTNYLLVVWFQESILRPSLRAHKINIRIME